MNSSAEKLKEGKAVRKLLPRVQWELMRILVSITIAELIRGEELDK